jgi:ADP-ribose pyrophosphatase YjhB (NUDIX family)
MKEERIVRCQAAIIRDRQILLVNHANHTNGNTYWWLPGGGLKPHETKEACVVREVKEETNLDIRIDRLLFERSASDMYRYKWFSTFQCTPIGGKECPGDEYSTTRSIVEVAWFDLYDEAHWQPGFYEEHMYPLLQSIRTALDNNGTMTYTGRRL